MSSPYAIFDKIRQLITFQTPLLFQQNAVLNANPDDSASSPSYTWDGDSMTGMYHASNNAIGFCTRGFEDMRVSSGNVGIGTTIPLHRLHVQGSLGSVQISSTGCNVGIGTTPSSYPLHVLAPSILLPPIAIIEEVYPYTPNPQNPQLFDAPTITVQGNIGWRSRNLNTISSINDPFVSLANAVLTITPGTYFVTAEGRCTGTSVGTVFHRIGFSNMTGSTMELLGTSQSSTKHIDSTNYVFTTSTISGTLQVKNTSSTYGLWHFTTGNDLNAHYFAVGVPYSSTHGFSNVYSRVQLVKYQ